MKKNRLVKIVSIQQFVKDRIGVGISDVAAEGLLTSIEAYILNKSRTTDSEVQPPYLIPEQQRNLSMLAREWLVDKIGRENKVRLFRVNDDWVGRPLVKITKNMDPEHWDDHMSFLFFRSSMVSGKIEIEEASLGLLKAFELSVKCKPRENYPLVEFRKRQSRAVEARFNNRVRIPKTQQVRDLTPFQALHMPDDEGCYSIIRDEPHAMKTFFRGNHGGPNDAGEISFWWSDKEDLWVLWTEWVKWVIRFQ